MLPVMRRIAVCMQQKVHVHKHTSTLLAAMFGCSLQNSLMHFIAKSFYFLLANFMHISVDKVDL